MLRASLLLALLLLATTAHAQVSGPAAPHEPTYRLRGSGLKITPGKDTVTLAFADGVTISGKGFELSAPQVRINIKPSELLGAGELKLPGVKDEPGMLDNPTQTAREMARELQLPEPSFSPSALQRIEATGGITAKAQGTVLKTPQLVSTDGGRSWLAEGRSTLSRKQGGEDYQLTADALLYDTKQQRAVAHSGVEAVVRQQGDPEIRLSADRLEFGIESGELELGGKLRVAYGDFVVTSNSALSGNVKQQSGSTSGMTASGPGGMRASVGAVGVNLKQQLVTATGGVSITDEKNKLAVTAKNLGANLKSQQLEASGGVELSDSARGIQVSAGSVSANLKTRTLVAGGNPTVKFGGSTFTGEQITVKQEQGKTVVEVSGEQHAKIDQGDVEQLTK